MTDERREDKSHRLSVDVFYDQISTMEPRRALLKMYDHARQLERELAPLEEWSRQVRLTIRGIDGQAKRLTHRSHFKGETEEIIDGYQLNTGLWHRLLGLLSSCPAPEGTSQRTESAPKKPCRGDYDNLGEWQCPCGAEDPSECEIPFGQVVPSTGTEREPGMFDHLNMGSSVGTESTSLICPMTAAVCYDPRGICKEGHCRRQLHPSSVAEGAPFVHAFSIKRGKEDGHWFLHGEELVPGLNLVGEDLSVVLGDLLPAWKRLHEIAPKQVPEPPSFAVAEVAPINTAFVKDPDLTAQKTVDTVAIDAARFRWRHSNYHDANGYEYGYCKVRFKPNGEVDSMLWASDEEIDAGMAADRSAGPGGR